MADDEFIGRERECAQLASPIAEALAGHGSLILVAGEAGVGKTTLVREALSASGLAVLESFATPGGAAAFAPLVEVLRAHLRTTAGGRPGGGSGGSPPSSRGWGAICRGAPCRSLGTAAARARPSAPRGRPRHIIRSDSSGPGDDWGMAADCDVPR